MIRRRKMVRRQKMVRRSLPVSRIGAAEDTSDWCPRYKELNQEGFVIRKLMTSFLVNKTYEVLITENRYRHVDSSNWINFYDIPTFLNTIR